jgi:hypothetical protein
MALSSAKIREFLHDFPTIDQRLPVAAAAVIHAGALLMWSSGALAPLSGAGRFAGVAMESATGGAAAGDVTCLVRVQGGLRNAVTTDTTSLGIVGVAATIPEATDDDTIRIETGAAITGTALGTFARVHTIGVGGIVDIAFKAAHIA